MRSPALLLLAALVSSACAEGTPSSPETSDPDADRIAEASDIRAGGIAFRTACGSCHASRDGADLALFGFADRDIVRRAVFHVDSATALQILRYVRSLPVTPVPRDRRPFQVPRARSDEDFARRLFGGDYWPSTLGEEDLLKIDPAQVAAAVDFPFWSDEATDLDWMGNAPLPDHVLDFDNGAPRAALAAYHADRTDTRLLTAVMRLRRAVFDSATGACAVVNDGALSAPLDCFEQLRWISNLGAQHVVRRGLTADALPTLSPVVQTTWWHVGQAARRSLLKNRTPVPQAEANWVSWMYLGWVLAPSTQASIYTSSGLSRVGLPRHATFVAVRSLVARPKGSHHPYVDLRTTTSVAPATWLEPAVRTAIGALESRQQRGLEPASPDAIEAANTALSDATRILVRRLGQMRAQPLLGRIAALEID